MSSGNDNEREPLFAKLKTAKLTWELQQVNEPAANFTVQTKILEEKLMYCIKTPWGLRHGICWLDINVISYVSLSKRITE